MNKIGNIESFLSEEFGLSKNEADLYIALLKNKCSTILELSEITGIARPTTYMSTESLMKKKLITQIKKGQGFRRFITAEPPEKLLSILQERKARIELTEQQLPNVISKLNELKKDLPKMEEMEVRYFKNKNEIRFIYDEALKAKELRSFLNYKKLMETLPSNIKKFSDACKKRSDLNIWKIMENSSEALSYAKTVATDKFRCRLAPNNTNLAVIDYMIFDGKVAIVDLKENNLSGILVNNENYYQNAKAIHEFVWQCLQPYEK